MKKAIVLFALLIVSGTHLWAQGPSASVPPLYSPQETNVMSIFAGRTWAPVPQPLPSTCLASLSYCSYFGDNGPATSAAIENPAGSSFDAAGNLYFADTSNDAIRRVDTTGNITTILTRLPDSMINAARQALYRNMTQRLGYQESLRSPQDVFASPDGKTLWVADTGNNRILRGDLTSGQWDWSCAVGQCFWRGGTSNAGDNVNGISATAEHLAQPTSVAVDGQGNLYVSTTEVGSIVNNHLLFIENDIVTVLPVVLDQPGGIAVVKDRDVLVVDSGNKVVRRVKWNGATWEEHPVVGGGTVHFSVASHTPIPALSLGFGGSNDLPRDVAYDPLSKKIFVTDTGENLVIDCAPASTDWGQCKVFAGNSTGGKGGAGNALCQGLNIPSGLAVHPSGYDAGGVVISVPGFNSVIVQVKPGEVSQCNAADGGSKDGTPTGGDVDSPDSKDDGTSTPPGDDTDSNDGATDGGDVQWQDSGVEDAPAVSGTGAAAPVTNTASILACSGLEDSDRAWCPLIGQWISLPHGARLPELDVQRALHPDMIRQATQLQEYLRDPASNNAAIGGMIQEQVGGTENTVKSPLVLLSLSSSVNAGAVSISTPTVEDLYSVEDETAYRSYLSENFDVHANGTLTSKAGHSSSLLPGNDTIAAKAVISDQGAAAPTGGQFALITVSGHTGIQGGGCSLIR